MPKKHQFYKDIVFFENKFSIMPSEITVDTQKEKGVMKSSTLRNRDEETIEEI
jgi:hypothetical protein